MSLQTVPGLFTNDVFVCLGAAEDGDTISSASVVVLAATVGDGVTISLKVVGFLMAAALPLLFADSFCAVQDMLFPLHDDCE